MICSRSSVSAENEADTENVQVSFHKLASSRTEMDEQDNLKTAALFAVLDL